jgi:hypothetical protein
MMREPELTPPLLLDLPDGVQAAYVPDSEPPAYRLDLVGMAIPVDIAIPEDLAVAGWYWHGSTLAHRDGLLFIHTSAYPPPGWPSARPSCFAVARESDTRAITFAAARAERATPPTKKRRLTTPPPSAPATAQPNFFNLVDEQVPA